MKKGKNTTVSLIFTFIWVLFPVTALSSDYFPPRVSYIDGRAAYEPAGDVDWEEVTLNQPLLSGDRIYSQIDSKLEIELGDANFLRLGEETDLGLAEISDKQLILELHQGDLIARLNHSAKIQVYTPNATVALKKKGLYRISVARDGRVRILVRKGKAEIVNQTGKKTVKTDQQIEIDPLQPALTQVSYATSADGLDIWSDRRDAHYSSSRSVAYTGGRYYPGVYDLDFYGYWTSYPGYGRCWVPYVGIGWAPFRIGRWGFHFSFGWTWISYEPWGWLPYHCGNWVYYRPHRRWCWIPGGFNRWHPGPVHFYHGGGYIGWAPRPYSRHSTYIDNRTVIVNNNTTIINNTGRRPPAEGMTVVRQSEFGVGRTRLPSVSRPSSDILKTFTSGLPRDIRSTSRQARSLTLAGSRGGTSGSPTGSRSMTSERSTAARAGTLERTLTSTSTRTSSSRGASMRSAFTGSEATGESRTTRSGTSTRMTNRAGSSTASRSSGFRVYPRSRSYSSRSSSPDNRSIGSAVSRNTAPAGNSDSSVNHNSGSRNTPRPSRSFTGSRYTKPATPSPNSLSPSTRSMNRGSRSYGSTGSFSNRNSIRRSLPSRSSGSISRTTPSYSRSYRSAPSSSGRSSTIRSSRPAAPRSGSSSRSSTRSRRPRN